MDLGFSSDFLGKTPKAQPQKRTQNKTKQAQSVRLHCALEDMENEERSQRPGKSTFRAHVIKDCYLKYSKESNNRGKNPNNLSAQWGNGISRPSHGERAGT